MTLSSINIGDVTIANPVLLAPMSGVTDLPFRKMVRRQGAGMVVSEMVASNEALRETKGTMKRLSREPDEQPQVVQLVGHDPYVMAEAAKFCEDLGADIIDINFGCPAKKVTNKLCGSAIMRDLPLATDILTAVVGAVSRPVTMKMRTGWDMDMRNAPELARIAEDSGIRMVTVHGRTREQKYTGQADWSFIRKVKQAVSLPVIANGDITDRSKAARCLEKSGADGVMIGRGAQGRPWFLAQVIAFLDRGERIDDPDIVRQRDLLLEHYDLILSHHGTYSGVRMARKHLAWYIKNLPGAAAVRNDLVKMEEPQKVVDAICDYYARMSDLMCALPAGDV
ncbi:tRNA dihydrouridine synthase DusB [Aestuariispira insulae]|uniref:tRNA-dihydrouridine synthase n=1 Tax=Aestuariispira insulae TaxID=1461337 RepID=A0A3D9HWF9_9PROT|nr:tRNA dihydrouridine synthase DusB [Aestuariispira insulae]RED53256.1 tRNA-U20-dihydrouridine synthase [Aestuariispira insulae]